VNDVEARGPMEQVVTSSTIKLVGSMRGKTAFKCVLTMTTKQSREAMLNSHRVIVRRSQ
jgi:hypothetical protein